MFHGCNAIGITLALEIVLSSYCPWLSIPLAIWLAGSSLKSLTPHTVFAYPFASVILIYCLLILVLQLNRWPDVRVGGYTYEENNQKVDLKHSYPIGLLKGWT